MRLNCRGLGAGFSRGWVLAAVALLGVAGAGILESGSRTLLPERGAQASPGVTHSLPMAPTPEQVRADFGKLPLIFEANQGQSDARVKFLARGNGYGLFLTPQEGVLVLRPGRSRNAGDTVVRMTLAGANPQPSLAGAEILPGKSNYFIGNDPAKWHRNVPQFARVRYRGVYPGIDLAYYGRQGQLEYDFEVAPGADPRLVSVHFQGPRKIELDKDGELLLATAGGDVRLKAPQVYQTIGEKRTPVGGRFVLRNDGGVGFEIGAYDRSRALVIDPILTYSTYLGGSGIESCSAILGITLPPAGGSPAGTPLGTPGCPAIAVDSAFNVYLAGSTTSTDFPTPSGVAASRIGSTGTANVFVTKLNSTGSALAFTTYLGGSGVDTTAGIAVDSGFQIVVAGTTSSANFPTNQGYQSAPEAGSTGTTHVFVSQLDSGGSVLKYSTYLSGNGTDAASGLALDVQGNAYVTGTTTSTDVPSSTVEFPATIGAFHTTSLATTQFFMSKIVVGTSGIQSLPYSTYFGGGNPANGVAVGGGIAVDTSSNVYITGGTNFLNTGNNSVTDFPILNAAQGCLDTPTATNSTTALNCTTTLTALDAFIAKINPTASGLAQLQYSTYVGGTGDDVAYGIAVDTGGDAYITGSTTSTDFFIPATIPFQLTNNGGIDAYVAKITPFTAPATTTTTATAVTLVYFSYLGGSGTDVGLGIAADSLQGARLTGWTNSPNFQTLAPVQAANAGGIDAFTARIDTTADNATATSHFSSYLGGSGTDIGTSTTVDAQGAAYVAGETSSSNFTVVNPLQASLDGSSDAFVTKLSPSVSLAMTGVSSPNPVGVGSQITFSYTIINNGDLTSGIVFTDSIPSNATFVSATPSPGSCSGDSGGTVTCNVSTLNSTQVATVTVILTPTAGGVLGNSAQLTVPGSNFAGTTASASATVNDFTVTAAPSSATVVAGAPASYQIQLTPTGAIPDSISLSATSGLPTGVTASFTTTPIPSLAQGPVFSTLVLNTTERITTTVDLWRRGGPFYAMWLPVSGLALLGVGIGGISPKRRWLMGALLGGLFTLILLLPGCGSSPPTSTTTGTPAGTYSVTVTATTGTVTRTTAVQLVVQ